MRHRADAVAMGVFEAGRGVAVVLLLLATGCGPESTTATITSIAPLDPNGGEVDCITGDDGVVRAEHPALGCIPLSDLVVIRFDLAPTADGRARGGFVYPYQGQGEAGVPRSVAAGLSVGDTLPATYEVSRSLGIFSGATSPTTEHIGIPQLDARLRAALPPVGTRVRRACPGSPNQYWEDEEDEVE
jgi:hypothetical protein